MSFHGLKERSILFAPVHWFTGRDVGGSEVQWAFDIVGQAARHFGAVDVVLDDLRNGSFPENVRVHALEPGRFENYLDPWQAARFVARYAREGWRLCRSVRPTILHHAFPWGPRTFNPLILARGTWFGADRRTRVVMGPLQQPLFANAMPSEEGARLTRAIDRSQRREPTAPNLALVDPVLHSLCRATLRRADALIAINTVAKEFVERLGVRTPVQVIPAGVRVEEFPATDRSNRTGALRVACVAFFIKRKNIDLVLEAVAKVRARGRNVVLELAGDGPEASALDALAARLQLGGAIRRLGTVANADIPRVYEQADVFVTMSSRESLPAAILEAMASGLPVISTMTDGARELVEPGVTGALIPFGDVDALAANIERYSVDRSVRLEHGAAARRRIERQYSWGVIGNRYAELYESLLP